MIDYLELYLKCVVLLLADAFEKLRNGNFKIMSYVRPNRCFSGPALDSLAMLNMKKFELKLISNADISYLFQAEFLLFL